jgi:hypothetical protein
LDIEDGADPDGENGIWRNDYKHSAGIIVNKESHMPAVNKRIEVRRYRA